MNSRWIEGSVVHSWGSAGGHLARLDHVPSTPTTLSSGFTPIWCPQGRSGTCGSTEAAIEATARSAPIFIRCSSSTGEAAVWPGRPGPVLLRAVRRQLRADHPTDPCSAQRSALSGWKQGQRSDEARSSCGTERPASRRCVREVGNRTSGFPYPGSPSAAPNWSTIEAASRRLSMIDM